MPATYCLQPAAPEAILKCEEPAATSAKTKSDNESNAFGNKQAAAAAAANSRQHAAGSTQRAASIALG